MLLLQRQQQQQQQFRLSCTRRQYQLLHPRQHQLPILLSKLKLVSFPLPLSASSSNKLKLKPVASASNKLKFMTETMSAVRERHGAT